MQDGYLVTTRWFAPPRRPPTPPPGDVVSVQDGYFASPPHEPPTPLPGDVVSMQDDYFIAAWRVVPPRRPPTPPPGDVVSVTAASSLPGVLHLLASCLRRHRVTLSLCTMATLLPPGGLHLHASRLRRHLEACTSTPAAYVTTDGHFIAAWRLTPPSHASHLRCRWATSSPCWTRFVAA
uniref:Uncharacterized protein n=1 Tax=Oryza barthii TaxID=65489 RepID=A0A0D3GY05_9ORYZ